MVATLKINGFVQPEEAAQSLYRTIEKDHYSIFRYSKEISRGTFKLDATQTPHTIDSTPAGKDGNRCWASTSSTARSCGFATPRRANRAPKSSAPSSVRNTR